MSHTISIVIPVKNEAQHICACIESWINQSVPVEKIVVIDSGSTDGTLEILKNYKQVELVEIEPANFNHGTTRNIAIQRVTTDLVLLTVGDGRAADNQVLEKMCDALHSKHVAGVCGHQIVAHEPDKNPAAWFRPCSVPQIQYFSFDSEDDFDTAPPEHKKQAASWDNVIAMYRTQVLRDAIPFKSITYGEDTQWAVDALRAGHTLAYNPSARIYHYHHDDKGITYNRTITMLHLRDHFFGDFSSRTPVLVRPMLSVAKTLIRNPGLTMVERVRWFQYIFGKRLAIRRAVQDYSAAKKKGDDCVVELHDRCNGRPFKVAA